MRRGSKPKQQQMRVACKAIRENIAEADNMGEQKPWAKPGEENNACTMHYETWVIKQTSKKTRRDRVVARGDRNGKADKEWGPEKRGLARHTATRHD